MLLLHIPCEMLRLLFFSLWKAFIFLFCTEISIQKGALSGSKGGLVFPLGKWAAVLSIIRNLKRECFQKGLTTLETSRPKIFIPFNWSIQKNIGDFSSKILNFGKSLLAWCVLGSSSGLKGAANCTCKCLYCFKDVWKCCLGFVVHTGSETLKQNLLALKRNRAYLDKISRWNFTRKEMRL